LLRFRKMKVDKVAQTVSKINLRPLVGDFDMPPRLQRSEKDKQITGTIAFILIIIFGHIAGTNRQRQAGFFGVLLAALVKADLRSLGVVGPMVDLKHIFHRTHELGTLAFWNAPL